MLLEETFVLLEDRWFLIFFFSNSQWLVLSKLGVLITVSLISVTPGPDAPGIWWCPQDRHRCAEPTARVDSQTHRGPSLRTVDQWAPPEPPERHVRFPLWKGHWRTPGHWYTPGLRDAKGSKVSEPQSRAGLRVSQRPPG